MTTRTNGARTSRVGGSGTVNQGVLQINGGVPLDSTLRQVTDQLNTGSPIQMSTTQVVIGGGSSAGRLVVRGDNTNPLLRLENSAGVLRFGVDDAGAATGLASLTASGNIASSSGNIVSQLAVFSGTGSAASIVWNSGANGRFLLNTSGLTFDYAAVTRADTSGTISLINTLATYGAASGTAAFRNLNLTYTINNTGAVTGSVTGIYLNATETNLNGATHNLINLLVGGNSRFSVTNNGAIRVASMADSSAPNSSLYYSTTANRLVWKDAGGVVNNLY